MAKAKSVYPSFRLSVLRIEKSRIAQDIEEHNANMGKLIEEGNYQVIDASVSDSPTELQVVLVLQRRDA